MSKASPVEGPTSGAESAVVAAGQLRVSVLVHLPEVLRELGANSDALVTEAGVDPLLLRDPENTIAFRTVGRLLEHCARRTGCSHLGLLVGQKSKVTALGVVGLLGQHSPDVGTALHNLIKHLHLHDRGGVASLERSGEFAHLAYGIYEHDVPGRDQIYAGSMAHIYNLMRGLCGAAWSPTEVLFPFRKPHNPEPFQRCFRAPLRFDAEHCALFFRATWLSHPLAAADPRVREALEALVGRLEGRSAGSIVPSVQRSLRTMLMRGQFSEAGIAQAFAVHRRTLNRRLEVEGTTFRRLLDDARFEVARQLLRDSDAAIDQIAGCLGYSGSTAFGRAFRRWSGTSPKAWRANTTGMARR